MRSALALVFMLLALPAAALDVPYLTGRVVDNAEVLSPAARERLAEFLKEHERETSSQIAVVTVSSLEGDSIEEFAVRVFEEWKLGQKDKDNGVLVVVAPQDRRMRIEVGYGLEGTLTDLAASRIIRNSMTPRFKAGDYDGGVEEGVRAIVQVLQGGEAPADTAVISDSGSGGDIFEGADMPWPQRILIGAFIFSIIGLFTVVGVATPGGTGWFMYLFLMPFWAAFPMAVVGVTGALYLFGAYIVAFPLAKLILGRQDWYRKAAHDLRTKGSASIGGFTMHSGGDSSSGSSWSSGSSSSSFSGGGGSSGGGGASGSW